MISGECFFFREKESHLWIVASDPRRNPLRVLIVNLTTHVVGHPFKETVCLLDVGDHPFVKHPSCVNYADSRLVTDAQLTSLLARDRIVLVDALAPKVLDRIRRGASLSRKIPIENLQVLIDQEESESP